MFVRTLRLNVVKESHIKQPISNKTCRIEGNNVLL